MQHLLDDQMSSQRAVAHKVSIKEDEFLKDFLNQVIIVIHADLEGAQVPNQHSRES
jgi:hypothetical protein